MVFTHDLPLFLPNGCVNERQWDLRNENLAGAYTRPSALSNGCSFEVTPDGIGVSFDSGQHGWIPISSVSNLLITEL